MSEAIRKRYQHVLDAIRKDGGLLWEGVEIDPPTTTADQKRMPTTRPQDGRKRASQTDN